MKPEEVGVVVSVIRSCGGCPTQPRPLLLCPLSCPGQSPPRTKFGCPCDPPPSPLHLLERVGHGSGTIHWPGGHKLGGLKVSIAEKKVMVPVAPSTQTTGSCALVRCVP